MAERPDVSIEATSERLAQSRRELQRLFEPAPPAGGEQADSSPASKFPRSAIMRAITQHGGRTGLALLAVALFAARPKLAVRLLRYLPVSAITKALVAQFVEKRDTQRQARH